VPKSAHLTSTFTATELEQFYRQMVYLRHFEEKCNFCFRQGKAGGYLHVYIGMEPLAVGWLNCIRKDWDYVITAYRDHGHAYILGTPVREILAEIMGRKTGTSKGKGGSMHLYDIKRNFFGGWGIVGGHTALGGGLAMAAKYRGEDRVTLCYLGDGASNAGVFFETLNMAGLYKLPIIFIIENNRYAMGTALERHAADPELYKRGIPFNMKYERVDTMDLLQTMNDAQRIIDDVRSGSGPYLVEAMTYRFSGHGAADHERILYRDRSEEEQYEKRDPIKLFEDYLDKHKIMSREKMEAIDEEAQNQVEQLYEEVDKDPFPDPQEVYDDVYSNMTPEVGH
jgi:pyruvate dehydrogenase E1 component alpha subunit